MNLMKLYNLSLFMLAAQLLLGVNRSGNNKKWRYSPYMQFHVGGKIKAFGHLSKGFVRAHIKCRNMCNGFISI